MRERGVLGRENAPNIGKSVIVGPGSLPVAGNFIFQQDSLLIPSIAADPKFQWDNENVSLAIDVFPIDMTVGVADFVLLQGLLSWEVGSATFGDRAQSDITPGGSTQFSEVIFDLQNGMVLTLPAAAALSLRVRYLAYKYAPAFNGAQVAGPSFRVNVGWSYGNVHTQRLTMTQIGFDPTGNPADPLKLLHGGVGAVTFPKPKFASEWFATWDNYGAFPSNFLSAQLFSYANVGTGRWGNFTLGTGVVGPLPPWILPWPADSEAALIINNDVAADLTSLRLTSILSL